MTRWRKGRSWDALYLIFRSDFYWYGVHEFQSFILMTLLRSIEIKYVNKYGIYYCSSALFHCQLGLPYVVVGIDKRYDRNVP